MGTKILIVDDERDMLRFMRDALMDAGYAVSTAENGKEALRRVEEQPDLIILDVMMPGINGLDVCRTIRARVTCPILFLSALGREEDRVRGLLAGGDDYLIKPLSIRELKARVQAHLRREQRTGPRRGTTVLRCGSLSLDIAGYEVRIRDVLVPLTAREFEIVQFFMTHPNQVFTREHIYERVWGLEAEGDASTVTEHVKKIRAKLGQVQPDRMFVATVWGVGYKWEPVNE